MPDSAPTPAPSKRTSTSSKRHSTLSASTPSAPKPPTKISPGATIATQAILLGTHPIIIGARTVLHPHATLSSTAGTVDIAEGCIIWERASVGAGVGSGVTTLEDGVVIETGAKVAVGVSVGEGSVVECFASIGTGAMVGKFCKIVPYASVAAGAKIPDYTVVYGNGSRWRIDTTTKYNSVVAEMRATAHSKQLSGLQTLIPSNIAKWQ